MTAALTALFWKPRLDIPTPQPDETGELESSDVRLTEDQRDHVRRTIDKTLKRGRRTFINSQAHMANTRLNQHPSITAVELFRGSYNEVDHRACQKMKDQFARVLPKHAVSMLEGLFIYDCIITARRT